MTTICKGKKLDGSRCKAKTSNVNGYCRLHQSQAAKPSTQRHTTTQPIQRNNVPTPGWLIPLLLFLGFLAILCTILFVWNYYRCRICNVPVVVTTTTSGSPATSCTADQAAANLGLPGVTDVNTLLAYFQVQTVVGSYIVEPDDCQTVQIRVVNVGTDYFSLTNPFARDYDGWRWQSQPNHPTWVPTNGGQSKIPQGTWLVEGITIRP